MHCPENVSRASCGRIRDWNNQWPVTSRKCEPSKYGIGKSCGPSCSNHMLCGINVEGPSQHWQDHLNTNVIGPEFCSYFYPWRNHITSSAKNISVHACSLFCVTVFVTSLASQKAQSCLIYWPHSYLVPPPPPLSRAGRFHFNYPTDRPQHVRSIWTLRPSPTHSQITATTPLIISFILH